jgi:hypothetical protein
LKGSISHTSGWTLAYDVLLFTVTMRHDPSRDRPHPAAGPAATSEAPLTTPAPGPDDVSRWIRGDFNEMPDLRVTTEQAARLWGIDRTHAQQALGRMVDAGFLMRAGNVYRRIS